MPKPPIDPRERYDTLRSHGMPRPKAAVIANSRPAPTTAPEPDDLRNWQRAELERHAAELGIDGVSELSREDLERAVLRQNKRGQQLDS